ncbi:MAG: elongation factor Ts [Ruminococcaceae bacterium]|jgi:elongation factor Ts|nr:elongation factor Ts [Oscillospiraceae bacterium]
MAFTAQDVKKLREQTGAGMMDCKKALTSSDGDFEKAIEYLREKGLAAAAKKAGRIAAEGAVYAHVCEKCGVGVVVEINSETDFVAKNADFQKFCADVGTVVMNDDPADMEALLACKYPESDLTVQQMLQEKVLTIGENIQLRRFARYDASTMNVSYIHMGGKIGVLVGLEVSDNLRGNAAIEELGKDVCMQIAAMRPQYLNKDEVPAEVLDKEREILMAQTMNEGKPANVAEKIVNGRINKFFEENCLVNQAFVKENKVSVEKYADRVASEQGGTVKIAKFVRFEKGEGLEKRVDNFAEEVASMTK